MLPFVAGSHNMLQGEVRPASAFSVHFSVGCAIISIEILASPRCYNRVMKAEYQGAAHGAVVNS